MFLLETNLAVKSVALASEILIVKVDVPKNKTLPRAHEEKLDTTLIRENIQSGTL